MLNKDIHIMTQQERKLRLEELRKEYINGTRDRKAIELEGRVLKSVYEMVEKRQKTYT